MNMGSKVPTILVSGFLGAGKTTFIQKLTNSGILNGRVVVLENEFGDIDLDGDLLRERGLKVVSVKSGCICCSSSSDFLSSVEQAVRDLKPDWLIIEPSGVARIADLLPHFASPPISECCMLQQVIYVVDACTLKQRRMISQPFFDSQAAMSDVIILTKTDKIAEDKLRETTVHLAEIAPNSLLLAKEWEMLSSSEQEKYLNYQRRSHGRAMMEGQFPQIQSVTVDCFLTPEEAAEILLRLSANKQILRGKGILQKNDRWYRFDYVPDTANIEIWEGKAPENPKLTIMGIGLNQKELIKAFSHKLPYITYRENS
ncbi:MAG: CobW family GTP-binding protein [Lachnospiraceae bacterium]